MRKKLILNDLHLGVQRSGGTTPKTSHQLRKNLQDNLGAVLAQHKDKDIVINGDLFDAYDVPLYVVFDFVQAVMQWRGASQNFYNEAGAGAGAPPFMYLIRGNHDISKDSSKLSSFDFAANLLTTVMFPYVKAITEPQWLDEGRREWVIPHLPNQDLFNLALDAVPDTAKWVFLHANYDNGFAVESDHSLNVSCEQAVKLTANGCRLIFGHEHQARTMLDGKVIITGNQWPSSVADCLHNPDAMKHLHILDGDQLTAEQTWAAENSFCEIDWTVLNSVPATAEFVRVVGEASAEQAGDVIDLLAKFRQKSEALVITNAVKIAGVAGMEELQVTAEEVKKFDVLAYLLEQLDPAQAEEVKRLQQLKQKPETKHEDQIA